MTPRVSTALVLTTALLGACTQGEVLSDYELQLEPRLLGNQDVFAHSPQVSIVVRDPELGTATIHTLGELGSGSVVGEGFEPLDGAVVGVLLQDAGTAEGTYDPQALVAYGEVGPFTLGAEGSQESHQVLLPAFGGLGDLRALDYPATGGGAVMLPSGDVVVIGGGRTIGVEKGTADMRRLSDLDTGNWQFQDEGQLDSPVVWTTATAVQDSSGTDYVFVAGGRQAMDDFYGTYDWWMLDAATLEVEWSGDTMVARRSEHRAEALADGRVVLMGGVGDDDALPHDATFEIFDPVTREFDFGSEITGVPAMGFSSASLGAAGVLVCGGGDWYGDETGRMAPVSACALLDNQGGWTAAADLPLARNYLAMGGLADGRVLACGGLDEVFSQGEQVEATATAWVYDAGADRWDAVGAMEHERAYHTVVPTQDGRAVVVGGACSGGRASFGEVGEPVACPEVFDLATSTFTASAYCGAGGSGALPVVAWHPDHGIFSAAGLGEGGAAQDEYGIIGLPPSLAGAAEEQ